MVLSFSPNVFSEKYANGASYFWNFCRIGSKICIPDLASMICENPIFLNILHNLRGVLLFEQKLKYLLLVVFDAVANSP